MRKAVNAARSLVSMVRQSSGSAGRAARVSLSAMLVLSGLVFATPGGATPIIQKKTAPTRSAPVLPAKEEAPPPVNSGNGVYYPTQTTGNGFAPVNVSQMAEQEALSPQSVEPAELRPINPPQARPESFDDRGHGGQGGEEFAANVAGEPNPQPPAASAQGSSPAPTTTFQGEQLVGSTIPPDTMGAVGPNHVVTVSNNQMNIRNRQGVLLTQLTLNAFWAGVTLEGGITTPSTFDPKIIYDRFNDRFFFITSANSLAPSSSVLFATTQTGDPTGTWNRYVFDTDPAATATAGRWADYPTIGHNSQWIVVNYNVFNYAGSPAATTGYYGPYVYVIPKSSAYANGPSVTSSLFQEAATACVSPFNNILGCGFTMAPAVNEDNVSTTNYLVEMWDSIFGQLRVSKLTGPAAAPVLTIGTQFPQSTENWRNVAARINTTGGYIPQRDNVTYSVSTGSRIMGNDSRINNAVFRNGSLWTSHHVMLGASPNPPGTAYGTANPDIKTGVQWWQIDPSIEAQPDGVTGLGTPPVQRGRIFDPLADNCNSGNSTSVSTERTAASAIPCPAQRGQFFAFAGIAVNKDNDVLVGFTQSSPLTYPSGAYAMRRASDPPNTMRDVVVFRSGASNYNIGAGTAGTTGRQNRWGDYSASQTDPVNDTDFWTNQEYSEARVPLAGLGGAIAAPWATWWAKISPTSTQPTTTGNLIISEFRLRGPGGINDEYVELYNPSATTPLRVKSVDNSEGWALAWNNGTTTTPLTVVPEGVVVPPRGNYLIANSPNSTAAGAETLYYSLRGYPGSPARTATADTGYSPCTATGCASTTDAVADNAGVAVFKSSTPAAFIPANQADAAGFAGAGTTFREGTGIPAITPGAVTGQIAFARNQSSGTPQDTNNNAADFQTLNTLATTETLGVAALLGAPGPENVDSPRLNNSVNVDRVDQSTSVNNAPNRVRDLTPVTNGALGTLSLRREVVNLTGGPVTRLRFRIRQITTFPAPGGVADLRALTSGNITVTVNSGLQCSPSAPPCNIPVTGTTVETPPTQPNGGGWNTTWTVSLANPIPNGAAVNVQFLLGVQQSGSFSIFINTEALP